MTDARWINLDYCHLDQNELIDVTVVSYSMIFPVQQQFIFFDLRNICALNQLDCLISEECLKVKRICIVLCFIQVSDHKIFITFSYND